MKRSTGTFVPLGTANSNVNDFENYEFLRKYQNPQVHPAVQKEALSNLKAKKASTSAEVSTKVLVKTEPLEDNNEDNDNSDEDAFSELTMDMKLRLLRQLCTAILPKDALSALKELKDITLGKFYIDHKPEGEFRARVAVNNHEYEGKGISKQAAKNMACEKALQDYMICKIEFMESRSDDDLSRVDLSMLTLASFASHKLVSEWKRINLPSGWEHMHPSHILNIMRPKTSYVYFGNSGDYPDAPKRMGVIVGNRYFEAQGRSKKCAKRLVSGIACNALFGTEFGHED